MRELVFVIYLSYLTQPSSEPMRILGALVVSATKACNGRLAINLSVDPGVSLAPEFCSVYDVSMEAAAPGWTFFTNHTHVLVFLAVHGDAPLREVAITVGITERSAQGIVADLCKAGILERYKVGRQNHYRINYDAHLRHPLEQHATLGAIMSVLRNNTGSGSIT